MKPTARTDRYTTRPEGDDLVLIDRESGRSLRLNAIEAVVWRSADGEADLDALVDAARGVEPAADRSRVWETLDALAELGTLGTPVAATTTGCTWTTAVIDEMVAWLGGYPVVLRVPGGEGGVGTMRMDSAASLYGVVDLLVSRGGVLRLAAYVPDAVHWRLVVVGRPGGHGVPQLHENRGRGHRRGRTDDGPPARQGRGAGAPRLALPIRRGWC